MTRALLFLLLWFLAAACEAGQTRPADAADDASRQILVLLNLAPEHFRPGSNYSGGYGGGVGHAARRAVAARLAQEHGLTLVTDWPMPVLGVDCYVMQIPPSGAEERTPERLAQTLSRDARVAWAQPMNVYHAHGSEVAFAVRHSDPLYPTQPAANLWRLSELHELATGRNVRVAVVDSGVEPSHPDLAGQVVVVENFVDGRPYAAERHGTAVAGIIGARADDGIGIAGIAPQANLMALRACWQESADDTRCTSVSLAKALHFAIMDKAEIVNLSLSGPKDRLLAQLIDAALSRGMTLVAAADPALPDGGFPASHAGVWAVTDDAARARGHVLLAPGRDVPTTVPHGGWEVLTGASYASAHVAGLAALLRELGGSPPAAARGARLALLPTGAIDTCATLMQVIGPRPCSCARVRSGSAAAPATRPGVDHP
jgi:subtilisin family serine protease